MRDRQQGGADGRDTVYGHTMCSWEASKLLINNMFRRLRTPSYSIRQDLPASIDLSGWSITGVTIDTGRYGTANATDLEAHPVVESTQIGGVRSRNGEGRAKARRGPSLS